MSNVTQEGFVNCRGIIDSDVGRELLDFPTRVSVAKPNQTGSFPERDPDLGCLVSGGGNFQADNQTEQPDGCPWSLKDLVILMFG